MGWLAKTVSRKIKIYRDMSTTFGSATLLFGGTNTSAFSGSFGPDLEVAVPGVALVMGWCGIKNDIASARHTHTHQ